MLMSTSFTNDFTFAITFNFLIVNTFVVLKFLMQSYDALEQKTTKSQFFVTVICGGYMTFVTDKPSFAITVAATRTSHEPVMGTGTWGMRNNFRFYQKNLEE